MSAEADIAEDSKPSVPYTANPHFEAQVLLLALLEQSCREYSDDTVLCDNLFKKMCAMLVSRKIIPAEFAQDSNAVFRQQMLSSLTSMMHNAARECRAGSATPPPPDTTSGALVSTVVHDPVTRSISAPAAPAAPPAPPSRYNSEFVQIQRLGSGAFGCVYKAKHKFDKQYFAVKKLYSRKLTLSLWAEIRREVELLASLRHQHVVGYNSSWVEFQPNLHDNRDNYEDVAALDWQEINSDDEDVEIVFDERAHSTITCETCPTCIRARPQFASDSADEASLCSCLLVARTSSNPELDQSHVTDDVVRERPKLRRATSHEPSSKQQQVSLRLETANSILQMQLCDRNLRQWLQTRNDQAALQGDVFSCVQRSENLRIFHQILLAVDYIHDQGIIHRDLKPGNIFLHGLQDDVKIGDFGLARSLIESEREADSRPNLSPGRGTALYAAPELSGHQYDHKCDMYSLGVVLYELYHPFVTESERIRVISNLRETRLIATEVRKVFAETVDCITCLTSHSTSERPTAKALLQHKLFRRLDNEKHRLLHQRRLDRKKIRRLEKDLMKFKLNSSSD